MSMHSQVVVLNTCSIREHAEAKMYSYLGPHAIRKRAGEDMAIIVAGCVAQQVDACMGWYRAGRGGGGGVIVWPGARLSSRERSAEADTQPPRGRRARATRPPSDRPWDRPCPWDRGVTEACDLDPLPHDRVPWQEGDALLRRVPEIDMVMGPQARSHPIPSHPIPSHVPEIDMVMGPQYANRLGDLLEGVFNGNQIVATAPTHIMEDPTQPRRHSTVCAWVNVIYGCNERCSRLLPAALLPCSPAPCCPAALLPCCPLYATAPADATRGASAASCAPPDAVPNPARDPRPQVLLLRRADHSRLGAISAARCDPEGDRGPGRGRLQGGAAAGARHWLVGPRDGMG